MYAAAASVESWSDTPVGRVVFRDVSIEYAGGGTAEQGRKDARAPHVGVRPLPAWGLYARKVRELVLEDVRLSCVKKDLRPVLIADGVDRLKLDDFRFPRIAGAAGPLVLRNVERIERGDREGPAGKPRPREPGGKGK